MGIELITNSVQLSCYWASRPKHGTITSTMEEYSKIGPFSIRLETLFEKLAVTSTMPWIVSRIKHWTGFARICKPSRGFMKVLSCPGSHHPILARLVYVSVVDRRLVQLKADNHFHRASFRRLLAQFQQDQHSSGVIHGVGAATLFGSGGVTVLECSVCDHDHDHK